jgi:hypothetical protein
MRSHECGNIGMWLRQKEHIRDNLLQRNYAAIMESYFLFIVSPSSIYAFWLLLFWYLKTCLNNLKPSVICMIIQPITNYSTISQIVSATCCKERDIIHFSSLSGICITSLIIDFICMICHPICKYGIHIWGYLYLNEMCFVIRIQ